MNKMREFEEYKKRAEEAENLLKDLTSSVARLEKEKKSSNSTQVASNKSWDEDEEGVISSKFPNIVSPQISF